MESSAKIATERVHDVKGRILGVATLLAVVAVLPAHLVTVLLAVRRGVAGTASVLHASIFVVGALILAALTRAPLNVRAGFVLVYALTLSAVGVFLFGGQVVDGGIFTISMVFAVIYLRWKGLFGVALTSSLVLGFLASGFVGGWLPAPDPALLDLRDPHNGIRTVLGLMVVSLIIGWVVLELMGGLDGALDGLSEAMEEQQGEREARQRTQRVLEQSQGLEAIGRLAGGVAHDFNNALVVILGTAQLLERSSILSERQRRLASAVETAAWQASDVSKQLLSFSRRDVSRPERVEIDERLGHMGRVLGRLLPEDITIEVDARATARVWIDASELDQVFLNLAIHSSQSMPSGGTLRFVARLSRDPSDPKQGVVIEVIDDGVGMDAEVVEHAFDPIAAITSHEEGRSLGLPLVRDIVEAAGGHVDCSSVLSEGTRFRIWLPMELSRESSGPFPLPKLEELPRRVLVAESATEVRALLARTLREEGYEVVEASSEEGAVAACRAGRFDIVCSDSALDRGAPIALFAAIGAIEPPPPIVLCSGPITEPTLSELVASGRATHLSKPFGPDELASTLERVLELEKRRADD